VINNLICVNNIFRLLRWNVSQNAFQLTKTLDTKESCSCIHFARHSIIVGCNRFLEIDIRDFSMEGMNKFQIFQIVKNVVYDMKFVRLGSHGGFAEDSSH